MIGETALQRLPERGWHSGLGELVKLELRRWWRTKKWWITALVALGAMNGLLVLVYVSTQTNAEAAQQLGLNAGQDYWPLYLQIAPMIAVLAAIILMQDALIGEKESGITAWVLSKPVSRVAYVLSKLVGNAVGILLLLVVLPSLVTYGFASLVVDGAWMPLGSTLAMIGMLCLMVLFYITLTLVLGAFLGHRVGTAGAAMLALFLQQTLVNVFSGLAAYLPITVHAYALQVVMGDPLPDVTPLVAMVVWSVGFTALALWRFGREEF